MRKTPKLLSAAAASAVLALSMAACTAEETAEPGGSGEAGVSARSEFSQELHDSLPAEVQERGKITVIGDVNPPWRIPTDDGGFTGLQRDLFAEFETILGVEFESEKTADVASVKLAIQSGRSDAGFGPLLSNETTREDLILIDYTLGRSSFLSSADRPNATSIADLCGATISIPDGTPVFDPVFETTRAVCDEEGLEAPEVIALTDNEAVILALRSGRAEFAGMSVHQAAYAQAQYPDEFQFYVTTDEESPADALAMGFGSDQADLAQAIFGAWQIVFDNGVYEDLMAEYNMAEITVPEPVLHLVAVD